jgi:hypothetical protein
MADARLTAFIEASLRARQGRDEIRKALEAAGWSKDQIADGLRYFADVEFAVPVPRPKAQLSARDAFMYLLMFGMLYVSAFWFGSLLFRFIDLAFPDEALQRSQAYVYIGIRRAIATLVVTFPVFVFVSIRVSKELAADPARRSSAVRRWLTYLTLLVAASVMAGDLITLIYNLLSGELTVRFILKVLVVAAIVAAVFVYYLKSLKADDEALAE